MAEGKNKIIVYADWLKNFEDLTDDELGKLMRHFFEYVNDKNPVLEDRLLKVAWKPIEATLKRDLKEWEKHLEKQKANGLKGGRPKANETQKTHGLFSKPKKADSVSDSVSDSIIHKQTIQEQDTHRSVAKHLSITKSEYQTLLSEGWTPEQVSHILDSIENYKGNKNYKSCYLTARNWLKREYTMPAPKAKAALANTVMADYLTKMGQLQKDND